MLFHLLKKDILISKKYVLLVLIIAFAIPIFILWRSPQFSEILGFALSVVFSEFMMCQNLSMKEKQYSKANALLCSSPYPRYGLVVSKYILFIGIFAYCIIVYAIDLIFFPEIGKINLSLILTVLLMNSIAYGVFLPVQYQMGYEKTKIFFMIIIMASPFVLPALIKYGNFDFSLFDSLSPVLLNALLLVFSVLVLTISAIISVKIFNKKELV